MVGVSAAMTFGRARGKQRDIEEECENVSEIPKQGGKTDVLFCALGDKRAEHRAEQTERDEIRVC